MSGTNINPITIVVTGDLCPHNRIEKLAFKSDYRSVFNDFIDVFKKSDLNVTDLECPLTRIQTARKKIGPHQKADPKCIEILNYADIKLAALANNHITDYGSIGLKQTIDLCQMWGINIVGAGPNYLAAKQPFVATIRNKKCAFINVADIEFLTSPDGQYQANPLNPLETFYSIQHSRKLYDYIIVIIHAGNEFYPLPSLRTKYLYRFFIDSGADVVVSNHTHCFSGFEIYNEKPIFYGLGNFLYDQPGKINSAWNIGYVVRLRLSENISFEIIPLKQGNENPGVFHLNENEKQSFFQTLENRNQIIADDSNLSMAFEEYVRKVNSMYDAYIEPYLGWFYNALRQRGFMPNFLSKRKRLLLLNLIRCEAHREVLLSILKKYE